MTVHVLSDAAPGPAPAAGVAAAQLRGLVEIGRAALDTSNPRRLLATVVDQVTAMLDEPCTAWLHDNSAEPDPALESRHPDPVRADLYAACSVPGLASAGPAMLVAESPDPAATGEPSTPNGAPNGAANGAAKEAVGEAADRPDGWLSRHGLRQCAVYELRYESRALGILAVTRAADRPAFSPAQLDLMTAAADLAGVAVQQIRMLNDCLVALDDVRRQVELTESISDALIFCDAAHQIVSWNRGAELIYGYSHSEALGCDLFALLATRFTTNDGVEIGRDEVLVRIVAEGGWQGELRQRRADGAPLIVMSSVSATVDDHGEVTGMVAVNRDVTEQRHDEHRAKHDALTGLPNRRLLDAQLYDAFARACRSHRSLAVLFIDLDGFKQINDTYGHSTGDAVLTATADRLVGVLRTRDTVGRLGGDEFVAILEESGEMEDVRNVAVRVAEAVAAPIEVDGVVVSVLASIGVAVESSPDAGGHTTAQSLLEAADQAMYVAKRERTGIAFAPAAGTQEAVDASHR